jgi:hypothetical protein
MTPKIARNATVLNLVAGHLRLTAAEPLVRALNTRLDSVVQ